MGGWQYKLGDNTAKYQGRLTFNPIASVDPLGALFLLLFGFGWAKPVPVNPNNFKNPKRGMAITALAGPVSNLLASLIGALIYIGVFWRQISVSRLSCWCSSNIISSSMWAWRCSTCCPSRLWTVPGSWAHSFRTGRCTVITGTRISS